MSSGDSANFSIFLRHDVEVTNKYATSLYYSRRLNVINIFILIIILFSY